MDRRRFLALATAATAGTLAGCIPDRVPSGLSDGLLTLYISEILRGIPLSDGYTIPFEVQGRYRDIAGFRTGDNVHLQCASSEGVTNLRLSTDSRATGVLVLPDSQLSLHRGIDSIFLVPSGHMLDDVLDTNERLKLRFAHDTSQSILHGTFENPYTSNEGFVAHLGPTPYGVALQLATYGSIVGNLDIIGTVQPQQIIPDIEHTSLA